MIPHEIKTYVQGEIKRLEAFHEIKILFACESGSRAWGFASPDSDYDIRFIFKHPFKKYISIGNYKTDMDFAVENDIDLSGWDLKKMLGLLLKSNATIFEWLQSPIIYHNLAGFKESLWDICPHYFNPKTLIHHYLGTAKSAYKSGVSEGHIKIKKYFYIIRPVLAAKWIAQFHEIPPMEFAKLCMLIEKEPIYIVIQQLLEQKRIAKEGELIKLIPELESFIEREKSICENAAASFEKRDFSTEKIDAFFHKTIGLND